VAKTKSKQQIERHEMRKRKINQHKKLITIKKKKAKKCLPVAHMQVYPYVVTSIV